MKRVKSFVGICFFSFFLLIGSTLTFSNVHASDGWGGLIGELLDLLKGGSEKTYISPCGTSVDGRPMHMLLCGQGNTDCTPGACEVRMIGTPQNF